MNGACLVLIAACLFCAVAAPVANAQPTETGWPELRSETRPWARWWWMGSAVSEAEITRHLELFKQAGMGGVEISPIYGANGAEAQYISFLSPRWIEMLGHTLREAKRLGLGVDMITGTGWPLGGPWVSDGDAARRLTFGSVTPGEAIRSKEKGAKLIALTALSPDGKTIDLTDQIGADGTFKWSEPPGNYTLHAAFESPTHQQVKRAAPGGDGNVLDHFSSASTRRYLEHFDAPLSNLPGGEMVRCFFNDSYEVYGANWTNALFDEFARRRGYDLRRHLPSLRGEGDAELVRRVRSDYRETIADLHLEEFLQPWAEWAHGKGAKAREQAHGAPGNILDLYAAADIPETETFGAGWLELSGLQPLPGTPQQHFEKGLILACKMASSAAHVAGKPLCSSESFTWLGEHGRVPLEDAKANADALFTLGINHIFFHGSTFSPADAAWPGWMFYASTHFAPGNTFWRDLPALNAYIARCQSLMQEGKPDNDVVVYLPIYDLWASEKGSKDGLQFMTMHNTETWLGENMAGFATTAQTLWQRGYGFDCVSDRLLKNAVSFADGAVQARGGSYRALCVAGCTLMPPETMLRLLELAQSGATILVVGDLPRDVPGLGDLENRRARLRTMRGQQSQISPGVRRSEFGKGQFLIGPDIETLLEAAKVQRETLTDSGLKFMRRRDENGGHIYFLTNQSRERIERWMPLAIAAKSIAIYDALNGHFGGAAVRQNDGQPQVYLQMEPGQSLLLRTFSDAPKLPQWEYFSTGAAQELKGAWSVEFIEGGPSLPPKTEVKTLSSWTNWPDTNEALRSFSGTARYSLNFERPAGDFDAWQIDLGQVNYSARVRLNGHDLGTLISRPFTVRVPAALLAPHNRLEIEVTNLMANRLADLDRRKVPWQKFFFVNIDYKPFDSSTWEPLSSGLLGPVRLVPLQQLKPE